MSKSVSSKPSNFASILRPVAKYLMGRFQKLYFRAAEASAQDKREVLVVRVETARDSLEEAKQQFQSALDKFSALTHFDGGNLEDLYRQIRVEYDYSQSRAQAVSDRIDAVEQMAAALFSEWEDELDQYTSRSLRSSSRQKLRQTQQHYGQLITAMRRAESRIDPVLRAFNDQVLYLKHNLNAKAVASLEGELAAMSVGVAGLITAMERSISRANDFVVSLDGRKALPSSS